MPNTENLPEIRKPAKQIRKYASRPPAKTLKNGKKSRSRKTSELPSKILTYGLPDGPLTNAAAMELEFVYGARWQNIQVAIVHEYRNAIRAQEATYPEIAAADAAVKEAQTLVQTLEDELDEQRIKDRKRTPPTPEHYAALKAARSQLYDAYKERSKLKWALRKDNDAHKVFLAEQKVAYDYAVWVAERGPNYKGHEAFLRKYQKPYPDGSFPVVGIPHWGTRGLRMDSVKQAIADTKMDKDQDPNFHPWRGDGRIGIQLTGKKLKGLPVEDLLKGKDSRLRLVLSEPYGTSKRAQRKRRGVFSLRIGTDEERKPVFVEFPVVLHRPLPSDGLIKRAWVRRQKFGYRYHYELQLVVEAAFNKPMLEETPGSVQALGAIDIGWRVRPDGIRVMVVARPEGSPLLKWHGEVVESPLPFKHGGLPCSEVLIPGNRLGELQPPAQRDENGRRLKKPEGLAKKERWPGKRRDRLSIWAAFERHDQLRSIRDRLKNKMTESLSAFVKPYDRATDATGCETEAEWLCIQTKSLDQWKSPQRLIGLAYRWSQNRFAGDEDIFAELEAWRIKERHLHQWQADMRQRAEGQRQDFYRCIAVQLVKTLGLIKLERFNLSEVAVLPLKEDPEPLHQKARRYRTYAAVSTFREALVSAAAREGTKLEGVEARNTTLTCSRCGKTERFDKKPLEHTCMACGQRWDQDENAAQNIATSEGSDYGEPEPASASVTPDTREPLAASPSVRDPSENGEGYT